MTDKITPNAIRKNNRKQIYDFIYSVGKVSQNDIASILRLSRPTVATNISELEEDGLIFKDGQQDSDQIGRKATVYSVIPDYRIAVGVELTSRHAKIIAVDLYGHKIKRVVNDIRYVNNDSYYRKVCDLILEFIGSLEVSEEQILGIGIAMQGLVSPDGNSIIYGEIMKCTGLSIDVFRERLPYKCTFIHDPEGAALSELWVSPELISAIYLSLSEHLGEENEEKFFSMARKADTPESEKWGSYLNILGSLIGAVHLVNDVDFILGGHLAPYFTEEDLRVLYDVVRKDCPFEEPDDFIHISKMPSHNINVGAALPFIKEFLDSADALTGSRQ